MITAALAGGIDFEGGAYQKSFTLADVRLRGEASGDEVILFWAKAGLTVVAMRLRTLVNR
jgi:hypothetical protein